MSDKEADLWVDLSSIDARREKLRETLDRMRSRLTRFANIPDSGEDVTGTTAFENSVEKLGYKATRVLPKSQYETYYSDEVYNSGNSKPGSALYEVKTEMLKGHVLMKNMNCPNRR